MTWTALDVLGQYLGNLIGDPIIVGVLLLLLIAAINLAMGFSFDIILINIAPIIWVAALPVNLGGAGLLDAWIFYVALMIAAGITLFGFLRMFNR
jgi:hypothetical protein